MIGTDMRICALVGKVDFNAEHFQAQEFEGVIAVDAGYEHLKALEVEPDCVVGDFDSLGYLPDHPHIERYPVRKDESDIELALEYAVEQGYDTLFVYGCLGGRLDFTYAVYQLIVRFAERGKTVFAIGKDSVVTALASAGRSSLSFSSGAAGIFSLFAASDQVSGVDEVGLEYALDQATLKNNKPLGVSNAFKSMPSRVSVGQGTALLFFSIEAWPALELD